MDTNYLTKSVASICTKRHYLCQALYSSLAEVPGVARVIIRLAAIPPTSRLDHSSTCASRSTRSWSCLDSKLISPSKLMSHPDRIHFVFTLKLVDPDTLHSLPSLVIAAGHESTGRASYWLAWPSWPSWLNVHPYWPSSLSSSCQRYLLTKMVLHSYSQELDLYLWHGYLWSG